MSGAPGRGDDVTRILVTGGSGYIGAHVVRLLQSAGAALIVVDDVATGYVDRIHYSTGWRDQGSRSGW